MTKLNNVAKYFNDHAQMLANEIVAEVIDKANMDISEEEQARALEMYITLMKYYSHTLLGKESNIPKELKEWSKGNAEAQLLSDGKITEIIVRYPPTRQVMVDIITRISKQFSLSLDDTIHMLNMINELLDMSLCETVNSFERLTMENKNKALKEIASLSAPVVPVQDSVAILPFIGEMDPYRLNYLSDHVVPKIADMQIETLIIDVSGMLEVDNEIFQYFSELHQVLKLLGIRVIATGLRPELAQATVLSGIELSGLRTYATVKQALETI